MLLSRPLKEAELREIPLRALAHLGDAVFDLFERERQITTIASAMQLHRKTILRVNAAKQADLLQNLMSILSEEEKDLVRRARNQSGRVPRKQDQATYRLSTAFEALLGYLYLSDENRLRHILQVTADQARDTDEAGSNGI